MYITSNSCSALFSELYILKSTTRTVGNCNFVLVNGSKSVLRLVDDELSCLMVDNFVENFLFDLLIVLFDGMEFVLFLVYFIIGTLS
jgi:hypothetical protein